MSHTKVWPSSQDWETGIYTALLPLLSSSKKSNSWSRLDALNAFGSVELDLQAKNPRMLYSEVLAAAYDELARRLSGAPSVPDAGSTTVSEVYTSGSSSAQETTSAGTSASTDADAPASYSEDAKRFATAIAEWPVFPDTVDALQRLKALGLQLVILSNVDRASFAHTRALLEHGFSFDEVMTAEEIGTYKWVPCICSSRWAPDRPAAKTSFRPNPNNHHFAITRLDPLPKEQILAVAQSLVHDHVPAKSLGLYTVWIDRTGAFMGIDGDGVPESREKKEAFPTWRFTTMQEFADAYEGASKST
jgi:FMN phosphatase YigB (HAD superfamily)